MRLEPACWALLGTGECIESSWLTDDAWLANLTAESGMVDTRPEARKPQFGKRVALSLLKPS